MISQGAFREYFRREVSENPATWNTYVSYLSRIDKAIGGLDEAIGTRGIEAVSKWGKTATEPPFDSYGSNARSALKRYLAFKLDPSSTSDADIDASADPAEVDVPGSIFGVEREMQAAVRRQLSQIEQGLRADDAGFETTTATGRVDILARDQQGTLVAIELKAGPCTAGALEQVLGYAQALSDERAERVRAMLIASSFPDRIVAAAKRAADVQLFAYSFVMSFSPVAASTPTPNPSPQGGGALLETAQ